MVKERLSGCMQRKARNDHPVRRMARRRKPYDGENDRLDLRANEQQGIVPAPPSAGPVVASLTQQGSRAKPRHSGKEVNQAFDRWQTYRIHGQTTKCLTQHDDPGKAIGKKQKSAQASRSILATQADELQQPRKMARCCFFILHWRCQIRSLNPGSLRGAEP